LGRQKANAYLSRLGFLKTQNISVFLRPSDFKTASTALLADQQLIFIDGELDFRATHKRYNITIATEQEKKAFEAAFARATSSAVPAIPNPVPLVGRPRSRGRQSDYGRVYSGPGVSSRDSEGAYGYSYSDTKAPAGVPKKLPKETILQKKESIQASPPPPMAESHSDVNETPSQEQQEEK
jgi:hypothetical protein